MHGAEMMGNVRFSSARVRMQDRKEIHSKPIVQMGNYQDTFSRTVLKPLRDPNDDPNSKQKPTFGNPFRKCKEKGLLVDMTEDYDDTSTSKRKTPSGASTRKRTASLNKDYVFFGLKRASSMDFESVSDGEGCFGGSMMDTASDRGCMSDSFLSVPSYSKDVIFNKKLTKRVHKEEDVAVAGKSNTARLVQPSLEKDAVKTLKDAHQDDDVNEDDESIIFEDVKSKFIKLIRRPGIHEREISKQSRRIKSSKYKVLLSSQCIKEAHRFKRQKIIDWCKNFLQ